MIIDKEFKTSLGQGLTSKDLKIYNELCIKANDVQLKAMEDRNINEQNRRNLFNKAKERALSEVDKE